MRGDYMTAKRSGCMSRCVAAGLNEMASGLAALNTHALRITCPPDDPQGVAGLAGVPESANDWHPIAASGTAPQHTFRVSTGGSPGLFIRLKVTSP